jgi:VanZ family protein
MRKWTRILSRWLPVLLMMLVIFWFSAQPSSVLPVFDWADRIVKKGGHVVGYALLGLSYWRAFDFKPEKRLIAWLLAVLYGLSDEFHQALVPGRHPSLWDVILFDNFGALISVWLADLYRKKNGRTSSIQSLKRQNPNSG